MPPKRATPPEPQQPKQQPRSEEEIIRLKFGNPNPQAEHLTTSVTDVEFAAYVGDEDFANLALSTDNDRILSLIAGGLDEKDRKWAIALNELEQIVASHTGGQRPDWLTCSDPDLERVAAAYYKCPTVEPTMLMTTAGRDAMHAQHLSTAAQPAAFNYVAITANNVAPSAADTTLTGEITTTGGGLIRKQGTYAHTAGTNTSTVTVTFTANGTDSLPVTAAKAGVFNGTGAVTMGYEDLLSATATFSAPGDNLTITETVTAG